MTAERELPRFRPPHPGEYLREDILPALNMTVTDLAAHLGVSRASLSELINGKRSLSIEMAQRLGKALGNGTRFWVMLQMQRDIWDAEKEADVKVKPLRAARTKAA
jgi:addiction module HigA family antidote